MNTSSNPYNLAFEIRDGYGYACVSGENDTLETSKAYWGEIGRYVSEAGLTKVLIVEDIKGKISDSEVFHLVTHLAELGFMGVTVAFVDRDSSHQDLNDFGVLVGSNRGLVGKAFNDETKALEWLLSQV